MRTKFLILSLFLFTTIQAQSPKTVAEALQVEAGCPLPKIKKKTAIKVEEEEMMEEAVMEIGTPPPYPPPPPPSTQAPPPPPVVPVIDMANYMAGIKKLQKINAEKERPVVKVGDNEVFAKNGLSGLRTFDGKVLVEPVFDRMNVTNMENHFIARKSGSTKYNYYDDNGTPLFKNGYDYINKNVNLDYLQIGNKDLKGAADLDGNVFFEPQFDGVNRTSDLWLIRKDGLSGIAAENGKILVEPKYKEMNAVRIKGEPTQFYAEDESGNLLIFIDGKLAHTLGIPYYKYGEGKLIDNRYLYYNNRLIDTKKKEFLFCGKKIEVKPNQQVNNLFYVKKYPYTYFCNEKGELIVEQPFAGRAGSLRFIKGYAPFSIVSDEKNERGRPIAKFGLMKEDLTWHLAPTYLMIEAVDTLNSYLAINSEKMAGMMDADGKAIIPFKYLATAKTGNRIIAMKSADPNLADIYDKTGKLLFETTIEHRYIKPNSVGYEGTRLSDRKRVMLNDKFEEFYTKGFNNYGKVGDYAIWIERFDTPKSYEIFDYEGKPYSIVIDGQPRTDYTKVKEVHRTPFFQIRLSDGSNYLYNSTTQKAHPINEEINYIGGGYPAATLQASKAYRKDTGIIDTLGNEILPPVFKSIGRSGDIMWLQTKERTNYFDSDGKQLFLEYDDVYTFKGGLYKAKKDGKMGIITLKNEAVIPIEYKNIKAAHPDKIEVESMNGKKMLFDRNGKKIKDL